MAFDRLGEKATRLLYLKNVSGTKMTKSPLNYREKHIEGKSYKRGPLNAMTRAKVN